jgi:shikimate kinase
MAPICVLVGPPGAGKTTTGRALAGLLDARFADTDAVIEERAGKPIPDIFVDDGEPVFRELEREAVATALAEHEGVLALGGGAILDEQTQKLLTSHTVVFLSVGLSDAVKRVGLAAGRPMLTVNPRATLKYLMDQRRPLYEAAATHTIATDGRTAADVAAELATLLKP